MKTLLILYMIYLSWGTVGQGRVSFLEMSRYLRRSKSQTKKDMLFLASESLVDIVEMLSRAGAKKYYVKLSTTGEEYLMSNFDAAIGMYHQHVADTVLAMKETMKSHPHEPRRLSKRELLQLEAGQVRMFEDDIPF